MGRIRRLRANTRRGKISALDVLPVTVGYQGIHDMRVNTLHTMCVADTYHDGMSGAMAHEVAAKTLEVRARECAI